MNKRRLLWVGDACVSSGFALATHRTLEALRESYDVTVLGINYTGDPHNYPYPIYPASSRMDMMGVGRLAEMVTKIGPAVVVVQNDPWNIPHYLKRAGNVPVIGIVAVDGLNCRGKGLNGLLTAIFWTQFGATEAQLGGYSGPSQVIPLGVDLDIYKPMDRVEVRRSMGLPDIFKNRGLPEDAFVVGYVGRNQPRKRLDLTIDYFAEWIHTRRIQDAVLWLHVAPTGERAYDLEQMCEYYKISDRVILPSIEPVYGVPESSMAKIYNIFDTFFTTTQGEGFHLPSFESMACGTPVIAPDWSALAELLENAAVKIWCSSTVATPNGINVIGGVPDRDLAVHALDRMYNDIGLRRQCRERGLQLVAQDRYRWENIGAEFTQAVDDALNSMRTYSSPILEEPSEATTAPL